MDEKRLLEQQVLQLQEENAYLKQLLNNHGITYEEYSKEAGIMTRFFASGNIQPIPVTDAVANRFFKYFWGRQDVYELRYENQNTGKVGYYTQCFNFWSEGCHKRKKDGKRCADCKLKAYRPLNLEIVKKHLFGKDPYGNDVLAIYPMFSNSTCRLLVFDFDNHKAEDATDESWKEEVDALWTICRKLEIEPLVERSRSGHGAHVWFFFNKPIQAKLARKFGFALLEKGAEYVNLKSFRYYDRMIPNQDVLPEGGLGNVVALPLQGMALKAGNSAFVNECWIPFENQLEVLFQTPYLTEEKVKSCIDAWYGQASDIITGEYEKPWNRTTKLHTADVVDECEIVLSNQIYIKSENLQPRIQNQIRRLAAFSNPVYFKNQAIGLSNYEESRLIYMGCDEGGYIGIPRGLLDELTQKMDQACIPYRLSDERCLGRSIDVHFKGELKPAQKQAIENLLEHDTGILNAATAFGKTVVCTDLIAEHGVNTLILIESTTLMEQWIHALESFLQINEEPPEYTTKTGRIKRRKSVIGRLTSNHDSMTGIVDVAMVGSLFKKGEEHPLLKQYGQVILDECHHAASETIVKVLQAVNAKYVYGVTATTMRGDGKEKINQFLLGPIRYRYTAKERAKEQGIRHLVYPRFTKTVCPHHMNQRMHPAEAYELLRNNAVRDEMILNDVRKCMKDGRTPVILTKYTEHAERLFEELRNLPVRGFLLIGTNGRKRQNELLEELRQVPADEPVIIVATGQLVGEGFDYPRLDTLFLATPISGRNVVEQYVGRLNRDYEGKQDVIVYDYVDGHVPFFEKMYGKRLKSYKQIGYELYSGIQTEQAEINAIYDIEPYRDVYVEDLCRAKNSIVISSPSLNSNKVNALIANVEDVMAHGAKVTVVTWHPDVYGYGKSDARMALLERLRQNGIQVELVEDTCEHFAIIDDSVVWYGSVNLLGKEDVEDNIMRILSPEIAVELLEITFGGDVVMERW